MKRQTRAFGRLALPVLTPIARRWVHRECRRYGALGETLSDRDRIALTPYFASETLDAVRIHKVEQVANPWFALPLLACGFDLDFRRAGGVTFGSTVVLIEADRTASSWRALLCHELVHVVQYRRLGIDGFVETYLRGWLEADFVYEHIPLELQAYDLEERFRRGSLGSVEQEVDAAWGD